jgi:hypothetical protein
MGELNRKIEAIKENNKYLLNKMRDIVVQKEKVRTK